MRNTSSNKRNVYIKNEFLNPPVTRALNGIRNVRNTMPSLVKKYEAVIKPYKL